MPSQARTITAGPTLRAPQRAGGVRLAVAMCCCVCMCMSAAVSDPLAGVP